MKKLLLLIILLSSVTSCTFVSRAVRYGMPDIDDYKVFSTYNYKENPVKFQFKTKQNSDIDSIDIDWKYDHVLYHNLDSLLQHTSTRAFLIIRNDSILYERYFHGYKRSDISQIFSVSKSITSLLMGIAIDEGYISSVNDPVTKYIPELRSEDPMFKKLTIKDLLNMRAGLKFTDNYNFDPFSKISHLYYGTHQLAKLKRLHFKCEPGTEHEYQSASTALLGIAIEKATHESLAKFFDDKVWKPLEMENTARWSLDDKKDQSAKAYCGLAISAIDLAKIGQLYLNDGEFNGKQIVSKAWIKKSLTPNLHNNGYQYQWYSFWLFAQDTSGNKFFNDSITTQKLWKRKYSKRFPYYEIVKVERKGWKKRYWKNYMRFYVGKWRLKVFTEQYDAFGLYGQVLFLDPKKHTIFVRLGDSNGPYEGIMYRINKAL
jgi:CubicO group peptidase (beta-lactamase class C family)